MTDDLEETIDTSAAGRLLTRLPGRARWRALAFKEFEESIDDLKLRYKRAFWPLFIPKPENLYRWRMQLECGCVREIFTRGKDDFPDQHCDSYLISRIPLPAGEYRCHKHEVAKSYRDIIKP